MIRNELWQNPKFYNESEVKSVLNWNLVNDAVEQAFKSTCRTTASEESYPYNDQPPRTSTNIKINSGTLHTMPGFVGDYKILGKTYNTLACKLVTAFNKNNKRDIPLPNIMANILIFNNDIGKLECIMEGTEITTWRTAAASIVATKYLYYSRLDEHEKSKAHVLSIIGCSVQGRSHAIGMCSSFNISEIRLWNRSPDKAVQLKVCLEGLRENFQNKNVCITLCKSSEECVKFGDIIVTATFSSQPLVHFMELKSNVHINAIGAGANHYCEIGEDVYEKSQIYIDYLAGKNSELKNLKGNVVGEVGEVINGLKPFPKSGISIFQSLGMAAEDCTVAQAVYEVLKQKSRIKEYSNNDNNSNVCSKE